jgi:hypothetical protein
MPPPLQPSVSDVATDDVVDAAETLSMLSASFPMDVSLFAPSTDPTTPVPRASRFTAPSPALVHCPGLTPIGVGASTGVGECVYQSREVVVRTAPDSLFDRIREAHV